MSHRDIRSRIQVMPRGKRKHAQGINVVTQIVYEDKEIKLKAQFMPQGKKSMAQSCDMT